MSPRIHRFHLIAKVTLQVCMLLFVPPDSVLYVTYAVISVPKITCQVGSPGLSLADGFEPLLVPSRLAFLQRSASGHGLPAA